VGRVEHHLRTDAIRNRANVGHGVLKQVQAAANRDQLGPFRQRQRDH
jgi:hypothetical protein